MAEQKDLTLTKKTYEKFCEMLDEKSYTYRRNEENFEIFTGFNTNDLPMDFYIKCDDSIKTVIVVSKLPFRVPDDKITLMAYALAIANLSLSDGCFEFDMRDMSISYRATTSYMESIVSKKALEYILGISCALIDKFNDKLFMLFNDKMSFEEFAEFAME